MRVKFADRILPILRCGLYSMFVAGSAFPLLLRAVHADFAEALVGVGAETMHYPGAPPEPTRDLALNGARVSFRTQTIDASIDDVLAHYESLCAGANAGFAQRLSTQTGRSDEAGYVACLDMSGADGDMGSLAKRFLRFSETGNLGELGDLRYANARRVLGASGDGTFLFTMWADSAVDLFRMLPSPAEDAGGSDLTGVPRPPDSRRVLSAWEAGQPSGVVVYRALGTSAAELESFYRNELSKQGWAIIQRHPFESVSIDGIHMLSAQQANRMVTVLAHPSEASETVVTILSSEPS